MFFSNLGKCSECHQDNTGKDWCHPCNAKRFQNEFDKWTSGDRDIDKFIQQMQLNANEYPKIIEWIPFDRLENITYLAKGGFGTVYKAKWLDGFIYFWDYDLKNWERSWKRDVCLKSLDNSTNKNEFLQEIKNQLKFRGKNTTAVYGITKNPTKNEYMIVMKYAEYGSLRKLLNNKFEELTWRKKSDILSNIINGLTNIHKMGLVHKDFHSGNIVNQTLTQCYITDFGLCKPVSENDPERIYGVIPFMAPETLSKGEYTQASEIYSFGMVMLEVLTSYPPYYNISHDANLVMDICKGLKPEIKCEIPQFLKEIMEECWNFEPFNRPIAEKLKSQLDKYYNSYDDEIRKQVRNQIKAADKSNRNFIQYNPNEMHPEAIYTSRHLSFLKPIKFEDNTYSTKQWDFDINDIKIIEWIPFYRLENVIYLAKGGFENWKRSWRLDICLKSLSNSINKNDFLQEIKNQLKFRGKNAITMYGITKNPTKNEYMMVMNYAESLRKLLNNKQRINLKKNIYFINYFSENNPEKIYGVIPYVAPETLSKGEYTQAPDIYSLARIKCEIPQILRNNGNFEPLNPNAANESNKNFIQYDPNEMHPEAIYTNIPKLTIPDLTAIFFSIPDSIIGEENETQEMECKFDSLGIN
ncbi:hypothetical protein Glove_395g49 [Diversispora epigaea]|uniref:Protein kinase domain-containing protein n=1 Tax=Diversispora epigaea TaxID=1348612 RepID=A0A397H5V8_9GLOM|nr:hypothetical protein Glove_395g49 [Diversispora epigaea]